MTAFRDCLITVGAALGAGFVVHAVRWWLIYPLTGLGVASGTPQSALAWAVGAGGVAAILAGFAAAAAIQSDQPGGWSLLLAVLVGSSSSVSMSMSRRAFPDVSSLASAQVGASVAVAAIALVTFHAARGWFLRRSTDANNR